MEEILISILTSTPFIALIAFLVGLVVEYYLKETAYKKGYKLLIEFMAEIVEDEGIELPSFIEKLIIKLHSINEDTSDIEEILQDEKVKKSN